MAGQRRAGRKEIDGSGGAEPSGAQLSHDDRSRIMSEDHRKRLFSLLNVFPGTVLVGGFVRGMWRLSRSRRHATLTVELFSDRVPARDRDEVTPPRPAGCWPSPRRRPASATCASPPSARRP